MDWKILNETLKELGIICVMIMIFLMIFVLPWMIGLHYLGVVGFYIGVIPAIIGIIILFYQKNKKKKFKNEK